jgi:hypothetical protein
MIVADNDNHRVQIFDKNMQFIKSFGSKGNGNGELHHHRGVTVGSQDIIIVCNNRFQIFDKDGNWKQTVGKKGYRNGEFKPAWGIAVSKRDGRIFISDTVNHCIQVFSHDGKFLFTFGSKG